MSSTEQSGAFSATEAADCFAHELPTQRLLGNVAFRLRMGGAVSHAKLAGLTGLLTVFALGSGLSALWVTVLVTLTLAALCALETLEPV